jgi:DNA-binding transcriptional MerR regulator
VEEQDGERLLTLEELTRRVGMSVRNVRFYTSRGLVPPPIRRGRSGYYSASHVARLELVRELQSHGFTLTAIERYLADLPADAGPEDVALRRTMLAPWQADLPVSMTRAELARRAGRPLSEEDLATLAALGIVRLRPQHVEVAVSQLPNGMRLLDLGFPAEVATAAAAVFGAHGREMAEELHEVIRTRLAPAYDGADDARLREVLERLKPLSVGGLVTAYEAGVTRVARDSGTST